MKVPRVPDEMTDAGAAHRLRLLIALFRVEVSALCPGWGACRE